MFETFFAKLAGKFMAKKMKLEDGPMDTKPWYKSKGIWTGIVTVLVASYATAAAQFHLPAIPEFLFALLGAAGIYTRATAETKIG